MAVSCAISRQRSQPDLPTLGDTQRLALRQPGQTEKEEERASCHASVTVLPTFLLTFSSPFWNGGRSREKQWSPGENLKDQSLSLRDNPQQSADDKFICTFYTASLTTPLPPCTPRQLTDHCCCS